MKKLFLLIVVIASLTELVAQISLTGSGSYNQNFNSLASSGTENTIMPSGWLFQETGTNANTTYAAGIGSSNVGNTYSYGLDINDRALGGLQSGSLLPSFGAGFVNNTGSVITQLPISYFGEQWRLGTLGREDRLDFQYSLNATNLATGTWVDVDQLDFVAPVTTGSTGLLNGNLPENSDNVSYTITGLNIPVGGIFWIRWIDFNATEADDGLAIDDFTLDNPLPVELTSFSAAVIGKDVKLSWQTATELNNYGFEIERKVSNSQSSLGNYEKIGFINGNGNSNSPKSYSFVDDKVSAGKYFYRLKQIDNDGQYEYSKTIEVDVNGVKEYKLTQNYPNPFNPATTIQYILPQAGMVKLTLYNILGQEIRTLVNEMKEAGTHTINIDASDLNSGMYIYKIESGSFVQTRKMTLVK